MNSFIERLRFLFSFMARQISQWTSPWKRWRGEKQKKRSGNTSVINTRTYFPDPERFLSLTRFRRVDLFVSYENCKRKAEDRVLHVVSYTPCSQFRNLIALRANKRLPVRGRMSVLNPQVDDAECSRVGGRLRKVPVPEENRHSLILYPKH